MQLLDLSTNKLYLIAITTAVLLPLAIHWITKTSPSPKLKARLQRKQFLDSLSMQPNAYPPNCPVKSEHGNGKVISFDASTSTYRVEQDEKIVELSADKVTSTRVKDIFVYPIKSCGGMRVSSVQVLARGLKCDRQWLIIDGNNNFVTMRKFSKMSLIYPQVDIANPKKMTLKAIGMDPLTIPVLTAGVERNVRVWKDRVDAIDQGDEVAAWLATFLGDPSLRLVYFKDTSKRMCDPMFAEDHEMVFPDEFPIMLAASESLNDFQEKLQRPITMARFRPNIVVEGCPPWADDKWSDFEIGNLRFRNVKPCARCAMPSVDPDKGMKDDRSLSSVQDILRSLRNGKLLGFLDKKEREVFFGSHIVYESLESSGSISVGDKVKVLTLL